MGGHDVRVFPDKQTLNRRGPSPPRQRKLKEQASG